MPRYDIPSDEEIEGIRSRWENDGADGEIVHRLCDAVDELKKRIREHVADDRHTVPTPPPEHMSDVENTLIGVAPPPPSLLSMTPPLYRCTACLDEFKPLLLPPVCPSCSSREAFPANSPDWPCDACGKAREGLDRCACVPVEFEGMRV